MFLLRRPSPSDVERFLRASRDLPLSYGPPGILGTDLHSSDVAALKAERGRRDEVIVAVGEGEEDFDRARRALVEWTHFDLGWVEIFPPQATIHTGSVVAVLIRHLGFWSLNGCRIIAVSEAEPARFGFTYGTLPNHAEAGEELFEVFLESTGLVMYRIRARSWANAPLARVGQPIVRLLQERFRRDSISRMRRAIARPR